MTTYDRPTVGLAQVMEQHPQLNSFGIGVFDSGSKTPEQRQAELADGRRRLVAREAAVMEAATA